MKKLIFGERGFTYAEVIVVMGIVAMLFGVVYTSTLKAQQSTSIESTVLALISDIKNQQTNAMNGYSIGASISSNYGVHFESDRYVLFKGDTYNANDSHNLVVKLPNNLTFTDINFPNSMLLFSKGSGEVSNFQLNQDTITLSPSLTISKTLRINKLGAVIAEY